MARPKTEIEVTVQDRASRALRTIRERLGTLNNGRVGRAMAQVARATDQATATLKHYAAAGAVLANLSATAQCWKPSKAAAKKPGSQ